jgi:hypothetical protein
MLFDVDDFHLKNNNSMKMVLVIWWKIYIIIYPNTAFSEKNILRLKIRLY